MPERDKAMLKRGAQDSGLKFKSQACLAIRLQREIEERGAGLSGAFAAFDADGTLWPGDANRAFMEHEGNLPDLLSGEGWRGRRAERCAELARRQAGLLPAELRVRSQKALAAGPLRAFPLMAGLFRLLKARGAAVYVISASLEILVEEALKAAGLFADKVCGAKTYTEGGRLSARIFPPLPYGPGKKEALLRLSGGRGGGPASGGSRPLLAAGNTLSDLPLLEAAAIPLAVHSAPPGHENFNSERKLKSLAEKRGWMIFESRVESRPLRQSGG